MNRKIRLAKLSAIAVICLLAAVRTRGEDFFSQLKQVPVDFGGFVSQGLITTTENNYLGDTDGEISARFTEAAFNATFSPFNRTTVSAQAFVFELGPGVGGLSEVLLDYVFVDYNLNEWIGFRAGRIKRPQGIYNTIRDVDVVRTSILLPQGVYDNRWRDIYSYVDGGSIYGYLADGALEYEFYYGKVQVGIDGGLGSFVRGQFPALTLADLNIDGPVFGGQLWWNTPLDSLRIGQAVAFFDEGIMDLIHPLAGPFQNGVDTELYTTSFQYYWNAWTFEGEYLIRFFKEYEPVSGQDTGETETHSWYISGAYQLSSKLAIGAYYSEFYYNVDNRSAPHSHQKEFVVSARYDLNNHWLIKAEAHYVDGYGLLYYDRGQNPAPEDSWWIFAAKTSFSF